MPERGAVTQGKEGSGASLQNYGGQLGFQLDFKLTILVGDDTLVS